MSHDPTYLVDGTHALIAGATGSGDKWGGKTASAHWWATEAHESGHFDFAIAFDPKGGNFDSAGWVRVDGPRGAASAIEAGHRRLDWSPNVSIENVDEIADRHAEAVAFADGLNGSVIMVHDDAIRYADAGSLKYATALAGNPSTGTGGTKSLVVSQDPWDLPRKGVRSNLVILVWVGPVTDEARSFMQQVKSGRVADAIEARHDEPHMWTVIDGDDLHTYAPVAARWA